jgi:hypothetical protein
MASKEKDVNYAYTDRTFDGVSSMWLRKSAEEAPEVGTYNYDEVNQIEGWGAESTDLNDFNSQWTSTLFGENIISKEKKSDQAEVAIDTLLNDIWFSILTEDTQKVGTLLERIRIAGIQYPADYPMKNLFGETSLWSRINDREYKVNPGVRDSMISILYSYHFRDL